MQPPTIGRNSPCPCGSGRKHKKCCLGRLSAAVSETSEDYPGGLSEQRLQQLIERAKQEGSVRQDAVVGANSSPGPLSERIIEMIASCLHAADPLELPYKTAADLAVIAWNLTLLNSEDRSRFMPTIQAALQKTFGENPDQHLSILHVMVAYKQACHPHDRRYIVNYELEETEAGACRTHRERTGTRRPRELIPKKRPLQPPPQSTAQADCGRLARKARHHRAGCSFGIKETPGWITGYFFLNN